MKLRHAAIFGMSFAAVLAAAAGQARAKSDLAIGDHWPTAVAWDASPPRAQPVAGSACEVANRYVTFISTDQAPQVPALFAKDALFIGVENRVLHGREEIAGFYNAVHQPGAVPLSFIDRGRECVMELGGGVAGQPGHYALKAIDHFTLDADGKIARLVIFFRPGALPPPR